MTDPPGAKRLSQCNPLPRMGRVQIQGALHDPSESKMGSHFDVYAADGTSEPRIHIISHNPIEYPVLERICRLTRESIRLNISFV
ncbi:hypothetical protein DUNSADRAFT_6513 [Dunaliella salina]|uniref:Encoded protein n=1 Tax=Dunaliella salina TaxID=3046 RepID=A0ABQ7GN73_DUNSA|nr:hypothetical protein DUNSADRAFT_6513 [Dunaliella salina]|eukprot:KAF5836043.1 hypothetical protein DUNSADRAFT_6513 [Dunaliella salina]